MKGSLFSIGIDLGTTNSALSFTRVDDDYATSQLFEISQWQTATSQAAQKTLPSFLFLPTDPDPQWMVGQYARRQATDLPGRVAQSAKSWLCLHSVDRSAPFLPWASEELDETQKVSPIDASAMILGAFREAWDQAHAELGSQGRFDNQQVTITVPASFDSAAQSLTLEAARRAGFPETVQLLEEPQAVFYRWLERYPSQDELRKHLPEIDARDHHVLIVDIGGGTSDFSVFKIGAGRDGEAPEIDRVAVSDHILLGGDNVDLALAHLAEHRLTEEDENLDLSSSQRHFLVARCRDLKERVLAAGEESDEEEFSISIPSRGASLMGGTLTTKINRAEMDAMLLDGFFPQCAPDIEPERTEGALKEWGLPYATDSAITHHLADFLREAPQVDAIIYNGGTLYPKPLRDRLTDSITSWQGGTAPAVLNNPEPDLAVARGAARYGWLTHRKATRIGAGAASTLYLEVQGGQHDGPPPLICVLPRGTEPEQEVNSQPSGLQLRVGQPVRFRAHYSTKRKKDQAGELVTLETGKFHPLPPLETIATLPKGTEKPESGLIPIHLNARLNALGLLQVACVSDDPEIDQTWPLHFNLRQRQGDRLEAATTDDDGEVHDLTPTGDPGVDPEDLQAAEDVLLKTFDAERSPKNVSPSKLLKELEKVLGQKKHEWNWVLIRTLWPALEEGQATRSKSVEHEEAWLTLAGYLLRPGYGADFDAQRIEALWQIDKGGLVHPGKRIKLQHHLMWRRLAGGLDRARQTALLEQALPTLRQTKKPSAELVRMAGALERVGQSMKKELIEMFLERAVELAGSGGYSDPYFVALGQLLNRALVYAGPEAVVPPDLVEETYAATKNLDWKSLPELQNLFLLGARVLDNPHLDVGESLRKKIAAKLIKSGIAPIRAARLKNFEPVQQADAISLFGESLPPGLVLS